MGLGVSSQRALCAGERGGLFILAGVQALPTLGYHTLGLPTFPPSCLPSSQGTAGGGAQEEAWLISMAQRAPGWRLR